MKFISEKYQNERVVSTLRNVFKIPRLMKSNCIVSVNRYGNEVTKSHVVSACNSKSGIKKFYFETRVFSAYFHHGNTFDMYKRHIDMKPTKNEFFIVSNVKTNNKRNENPIR